MNLVSDMKILHVKKFKEGKIKQASLLKSFKPEIFELISLGYKPSEIKDYLEEKLDISINMNTFYAWLNYSKQEHVSKQKHSMDTPTISPDENPLISDNKRKENVNTADILSSTDYD